MSVVAAGRLAIALCVSCCIASFFFCQAEDGIRDYKVTGVQTCALPISADEVGWLLLTLPVPALLGQLAYLALARPWDVLGLPPQVGRILLLLWVLGVGAFVVRSEEHTSELQSPCNLVCRLLLEKKKHTRADNCISDTVYWRITSAARRSR